MQGQLFTKYFLEEGIRATPEWPVSVAAREEFESFREGVRQRYEALALAAKPNEAVTEQELIRPVLELLGWTDYLPQQGTSGGEDIPDHLLFVDADSKARAAETESSGANAVASAVPHSSESKLLAGWTVNWPDLVTLDVETVS